MTTLKQQCRVLVLTTANNFEALFVDQDKPQQGASIDHNKLQDD